MRKSDYSRIHRNKNINPITSSVTEAASDQSQYCSINTGISAKDTVKSKNNIVI